MCEAFLQDSQLLNSHDKVFEQMCESSSRDMRISVLFELFPLEKINSVANDATAFNIRGQDSNVLCIAAWDEDSAECSVQGKEAAYAMTDIVSDAEEKPETSKTRAYGNYGAVISKTLNLIELSLGLQSVMRNLDRTEHKKCLVTTIRDYSRSRNDMIPTYYFLNGSASFQLKSAADAFDLGYVCASSCRYMTFDFFH